MSKRMKVAAAAAAAVLVAGVGLWSAQSSASSHANTHRGWPTTSARSVKDTVHQAKASAASSGSEVLVFVEHTQRATDIDVGDPGESAGDYFLFESALKSADDSRTVGRDSGQCTLGIRTFTCEATLVVFGKGKLTVSGTFFSESDARIPIVGGTGAYKSAGGQMTLGSDGNNDILVLEVTR